MQHLIKQCSSWGVKLTKHAKIPKIHKENKYVNYLLLREAVKTNADDAIDALLVAGADPNFHAGDISLLYIAARKDSFPIMQALIRSGADLINLPIEDAQKLFKTAIAEDSDFIINQLIKLERVRVNEPVEADKLPLQLAIDLNVDTVETLLKNGADLKLLSHEDVTILFKRTLNMGPRIKDFILSQLINTNCVKVNEPFEAGKLPLQLVVIESDMRSAEILLKNGADLKLLPREDIVTLFKHALLGSDFILNQLINTNCVKVNEPFEAGKLPLQLAIDSCISSVGILLQNGADLKLLSLSHEDITNLFKRAVVHESGSVMQQLIDEKLVQVNEFSGGELPLQWAIRTFIMPMNSVETLLKNGANLKLLPRQDITRLFNEAVHVNAGFVIEQLISTKLIQVNKPFLYDLLPLQLAIGNNLNSIESLLANGADLKLLLPQDLSKLFKKALRDGNSFVILDK